MNTDSRIVVEIKVILPRELVDRIDEIAEDLGCDREEAIRRGVERAYPAKGIIEELEQ